MNLLLAYLPFLITLLIVALLVTPVIRLHLAINRRKRRLAELQAIFQDPNSSHEEAIGALKAIAEMAKEIGTC